MTTPTNPDKAVKPEKRTQGEFPRKLKLILNDPDSGSEYTSIDSVGPDGTRRPFAEGIHREHAITTVTAVNAHEGLKEFAMRVATQLIIIDDDHPDMRVGLQNEARKLLNQIGEVTE